MSVRVFRASEGRLAARVESGVFDVLSDVPAALGGDDLGMDPHALLDASLGACTVLTVMMYARRKGLPLEDMEVEILRDDSQEKDGLYRLERRIAFFGAALSDEDRSRLLDIANRCPIHRLMHGRIEVSTSAL